MAANLYSPSNLGAAPFNIYADTPGLTRTNSNLPGGQCNYVDLTPGANGSRCGCRRFWSRQQVNTALPEQAGWCMCNHHACFHDDTPTRDGTPVPELDILPGQENERPRNAREPLSPVMDMMMNHPTAAAAGLDIPSFGAVAPLSFIHNDPILEASHHPGVPPTPRAVASLPDTLAWGDFIPSQPDPNTLPPIPPQCLIPSQTASVASSSRARYLRPFAGKGLQTLSGVSPAKPHSPLHREARIPSPTFPRPSRPGYAMPDGPREDDGRSTPRQSHGSYHDNGLPSEALKNLSDTVSGHAQRLDRLETVSFSAPNHEECHEKHDHMDLRVTDLESRVEEVEKMVNDNASIAGRHLDKADDAASQSAASIASTLASRTARSQELFSQIQTLQAQIQQLQSTVPTFAHAWEVEVVFLPFPLQKIWQKQDQFKSDSSTRDDEWTQLPMTYSTATMRSQSPFYGDWGLMDQEMDWLLPKACSDKSISDKRLRSRGLIKTVSVKAPDARSVQTAINSVFGNVFREMQLQPRQHSNDPRVSRFMGLQSAWVPLRKIHKDSRLRFLSPSEMVTPALWDVQFLSSVMMRSATPRLFVTQADAYLQDHQAFEQGWTWQRVREMSPSNYDAHDSQESISEGAKEEHWEWHEQLDATSNVHTAALAQSMRRLSHPPSHPAMSENLPRRSSSPMITRASSPLLKNRRGSRPPRISTGSMPLARQTQSPIVKPRRVSSAGNRWSSPSVQVPQSTFTKPRPRRSPSYPRNTPKWTASPSPVPFGLHEQPLSRGITPFAPATPYSNAPPLQEIRPVRGMSVGRNVPEHHSEVDMALDADIEIFQSSSDGSYKDDDDESLGSIEMVTHTQAGPSRDSQHAQLPEDEVWPGIEDQDNLSDGENIDPRYSDHASDTSSAPSEYPSTQQAWAADADGDFEIHIDEDGRFGN
ncbi:hypothetical protein B0I35DRAFT_474637 [Stachybotrys elegans]|uniref:Uncharacterized protein n=1 Tax=Stachybotrys elegans TaxID=80388 RepID=A0A8K0WWI5_9HYPO|nr:hypothetical protein B0I35DRAFT_474637 [Stachybotrys elegans]